VGLSALLTTTMPAMEKTVAAIRASGANGPGILIGGAPVTAEYAAKIGADDFAPDAGAAVDALRSLLGS
jgi:methanogenic corrinoid protein MtbC1